MLPPLPRCSRWAYSSLKLAHPYQPSPKPLSGRPAHRPFRGLLGVYSRCGLHTRAVTKTVTVIRRLQTFRLLHACSGCFRLERSPGGACTRWKSAALSRRTWTAVLRRNDRQRRGRADNGHSIFEAAFCGPATQSSLLSAVMLAGYKIAAPGRYRPPARMGCDYQQTFSLTLAISAISASCMRSRIMPNPAAASL